MHSNPVAGTVSMHVRRPPWVDFTYQQPETFSFETLEKGRENQPHPTMSSGLPHRLGINRHVSRFPQFRTVKSHRIVCVSAGEVGNLPIHWHVFPFPRAAHACPTVREHRLLCSSFKVWRGCFPSRWRGGSGVGQAISLMLI